MIGWVEQEKVIKTSQKRRVTPVVSAPTLVTFTRKFTSVDFQSAHQ
jgi:hypothetical protein